jgi:hypothetical protein
LFLCCKSKSSSILELLLLFTSGPLASSLLELELQGLGVELVAWLELQVLVRAVH